MAKVVFEFKSDFTRSVEKGLIDGITSQIHVEFDGDKNSPTGALAIVMANHRQEIISLAMNKLVEALRETGQVAEFGIYQPEQMKH
ncbi:hypothetical protein [Citrobacter koseri]|uniref:hypothetical protein n=1 Tax=Citrobacter koseri TaxID=545 RepID=UPI0019036C65|nr:hypothetical protein [Citrobacter koseri]MBJ8950892.1 hypothetical protein [Citrobacter koseri]MBJ9011188.1 hypothetical protein [Citrobacter koseri]MDM9066577.1 hypothetical protein [Citrobacter koseri]MDM9082967.1 hypothetical protein [Citrobacter koseri]MDM9088739.1 hypothetical protein [Citrobacter koseri]